jgi:hypothetical protein
VRNLIQLQDLGDPGHHPQEIDDTPVVHSRDLFQQN